MFLKQIKQLWEFLNKIHPETRSLIIILLFGWILYSQITDETQRLIQEKSQQEILNNKQAELYSIETSVEINRQVQTIAEKDEEAFDVLLLNYHNNTQSLQGYKYLYLSCLTEAPRCIDTPLLGQQWNKIDYIYYADELAKIHNQGFVHIDDIDCMTQSLPKLYRLVKSSDAQAVSFYTIENTTSAIGMIVILYKSSVKHSTNVYKAIIPSIQKLAILLDYDNNKK